MHNNILEHEHTHEFNILQEAHPWNPCPPPRKSNPTIHRRQQKTPIRNRQKQWTARQIINPPPQIMTVEIYKESISALEPRCDSIR